MRHLVRATAYVPSQTHNGTRVAAPDEDLFTLLVTALECLDPGTPPSPPPISMDLVAALPMEYDPALVAAWGAPVSVVVRTEPEPEGLVRAITSAESGTGGDLVVAAAEGPGTAPQGPTRAGRDHGAGAVALRFVEGPGPSLTERLGSLGSPGSMLDLAFELRHLVPPDSIGDWTDDWSVDRSSGTPHDPVKAQSYATRSLSAVSEGAYIPRARYRESLASRWRFCGERCPRCSSVTFPSRGACRSCRNRESLEPIGLPRHDLEVIATTVIGPGGQPTEFDPQVESLGPYEVVIAELTPGARVTLQLTDAEPGSVAIGDRVDTRLRRLYPMEGEWRYGRKAIPRRRDGASSDFPPHGETDQPNPE